MRLKSEVIKAYGSKCVICDENSIYLLSIDHITSENKKKKGKLLYSWLRANKFPKDNYQVLCYNCNCAKGFYPDQFYTLYNLDRSTYAPR